MTITGDWTLFYDWNSDGSYSQTSMTVAAAGTFADGEGHTGKWVQIAGMFMFTYNNSETTYAGNWASRSITGISTTFSGLKGSFYMLQKGVPTAFNDERLADKKDASGK
ncbi:MAG: hypothetical protein ABI707_02730 [Ferruginibacter sp.]